MGSWRVLLPRLPRSAARNALTQLLESLQARRVDVIDLTETNPTRAGLDYPSGLLESLTAPEALTYEPFPLGMPAARSAVAADQRRRGIDVDPAHVVLTASTSEGYSWLFKLLCKPGDAVLVPTPSYPLFEQLTALDAVGAHPYSLEYHGQWSIDVASLADAPDNTRAVLVVSPNNPTGSYLTRSDLEHLSALCVRRRWALIVDEVFADYPLEMNETPLTDIACRSTDVLCFSLGGLSKTVGLPQLKLGWMIVGGPASERDPALTALELIADAYLSVATPVQVAASHLLCAGASVRAAIHARVRGNLEALRASAAMFPSCDVLRVEGGWSAVVRVPATRPEEQLVVDLLEREHVLAHPGYFFDFPREAYLVVSLLPPPDVFGDGVARLLRFVTRG
jgi:aspartate/methionine/tyrosine aminotransferase